MSFSSRVFAAFLASLWLAFSPLSLAQSVNINTADASTLARDLAGIGETRARAIVEYRTSHGPFKSVDELALVKGIGPRAIEQNRERVRVEPGPAAGKPTNTAKSAPVKKSAPAR